MKLRVALNVAEGCTNKYGFSGGADRGFVREQWRNMELELEQLLKWMSDGGAWCATHFLDNHRKGANAQGSMMTVLDVDGDFSLEEFWSTGTARQFCAATITSCSHGKEGLDRYRALFLHPVLLKDAQEVEAIYKYLERRLLCEFPDRDEEKLTDDCGKKAERLWYGNDQAVVRRNPEASSPLEFIDVDVLVKDYASPVVEWQGEAVDATEVELEQCRWLLRHKLRPSEPTSVSPKYGYDYFTNVLRACASTGDALREAFLEWASRGHHGSNSTNASNNLSLGKYRSFDYGHFAGLMKMATEQSKTWKWRYDCPYCEQYYECAPMLGRD